jgi:hypothetical protein
MNVFSIVREPRAKSFEYGFSVASRLAQLLHRRNKVKEQIVQIQLRVREQGCGAGFGFFAVIAQAPQVHVCSDRRSAGDIFVPALNVWVLQKEGVFAL